MINLESCVDYYEYKIALVSARRNRACSVGENKGGCMKNMKMHLYRDGNKEIRRMVAYSTSQINILAAGGGKF